MSSNASAAVILLTIDSLKSHGSWCGETHIQKTAYICNRLIRTHQDYRFILYKHGPFSFNLSEKISGLIADELISIVAKPPYGPSLVLSEQGEDFLERTKGSISSSEQINWICAKIGRKGVLDLEKVATAQFVIDELPSVTDDDRAKRINALKPHVSAAAAKVALTEVRELASALSNVERT